MKGNVTRRGKESWRLKVMNDGKLHLKTVHCITKKEAQAALNALINEIATGTAVAPDKITVGEFLADWLGRKQLSPLSAKTYGEHINGSIIPKLGAVQLQELKPVAIQDWLDSMKLGRNGRPRSNRTILHAFRILRAALAAAVRRELIRKNPADHVEPITAPHKEVSILKADDIQTVLAVLRGTTIFPVAALAIATGARRSELLALRWQDIDLQTGSLRIEHSLEQIRGSLRLKAPKTKAGKRVVSLPAFAVELLNGHRKEQLELRMKLGMGKPADDGYVFCNADGKPVSPNYFSIMWARAVRRAGLPAVTFHSLRHSHASALINSGMDVVRVSRQLGHSNANITLGTYAHCFRDADQEAAEVMSKVLR